MGLKGIKLYRALTNLENRTLRYLSTYLYLPLTTFYHRLDGFWPWRPEVGWQAWKTSTEYQTSRDPLRPGARRHGSDGRPLPRAGDPRGVHSHPDEHCEYNPSDGAGVVLRWT